MENQSIAAETTPMNEYECDDLFEQAVNTAYQTFKQVTDDHVLGVFERMAWNQAHGLDMCGAATVH